MSYRNLRAPAAEGNRSAHGYFDAIRVWLQEPATRSELRELARHCGRGGVYWKNGGARFSSEYRQIIVARQPNETALKWITDRDDALVNGAEIALDTTYGSDRAADAMFCYFYRHAVRSHHGKTQKLRFYRESNLYDGQRRHPNILTLYRTQNDRFTGEIRPTVHLEWRANGVEALKQAGLPEHLLDFDFRQFWQKRLLLVDVEPERLGRYLRNTALQRRSRTPELKQVGDRTVNLHRRLGHHLLSKYDRLQELLDAYRHERVARVFYRLDNRAFLPKNGYEAFETQVTEKPNWDHGVVELRA